MTRAGAAIIRRLFESLIYSYKKNSTNRDTHIFNKLREAYDMFIKEYYD